MMSIKNDIKNRKQIEMVALEQLVPNNHLLKKIDSEINFDFIYDLMKPLYSEFNGRPGIDPVVLIKILMIQMFFGIKSVRQTIKEIQVNVAYRWFLNYTITEKIPNHSTISKNYERRFKLTEEEIKVGKKSIFEEIFDEVLNQVAQAGLLDMSELFVDATHIKASANKKKFTREEVEVIAGEHIESLKAEIDLVRETKGNKEINWVKELEKKKTKQRITSTTDPECGMFYKDEKEKTFCYKATAVCTKDNYVVAVDTTAGNIHDSKIVTDNYDKLIGSQIEKGVKAVSLDAGYKTPAIAKKLVESGVAPILPYTAPKGKKDGIRKKEFEYIREIDAYACPMGQPIWYTTTDKQGYKQYKSDSQQCKNCPMLDQCTKSKNHQKVITRHVWADYLDIANDYRYTLYHRLTYKLRSQTIERVFADGKEKHAMRYTHKRGLERVKAETTLKFACMNIKKLATMKWRARWIAYYEAEIA